MMGFPVRVMETSDRKRLPTTLGATLRADRAAARGKAILAIVAVARMVVAVSSSCLEVWLELGAGADDEGSVT